ncbi:MAG: PorV/PorQ family protein [Elusimicrobia bacterium]|nr:PorV/PorQ family protein [Elusimicrobiota bacterium]
MKILRAALVCALAGALARPAAADTAAGAESFDFLLLDANARAVGLGGAYTALATDANALLYNPAGLGLVGAHEATFMHNQYVQGLTQDYAAFAFKQGFGVNLNYLDFSNIPRTTLANPDGTLGSFGISDLALGAGYGRSFYDGRLALGGGAKYLRETIDKVSADGYAFDAGVLAKIKERPGLSLGAAVLNVGPEVRYVSTKEKLPSAVRAGAAYRCTLKGTDNTFAFDLSKVRTDKLRIGVGVETLLSHLVALRAGFTTRNDTDIGITGGLGVNWRSLAVDYAFVPFAALGIAHRISLTFRWGSETEDRPVALRGELVREMAIPQRVTVEERFAAAFKSISAGDFLSAKAELATAAGLMGPEDRRMIVYYERMGFIAFKEGRLEKAKSYYMDGLKFAAALGMRDDSVADLYAGMGECLLQEDETFAHKFFAKALEVGPSAQTRALVESRLKTLNARKRD